MIQFIASAQERKMIDVGNHQLDVKIKRGGEIYVIFESGAGDGISSWDSIFDQVGTFATAIAYSRAGIGKSEMDSLPRTTEAIYEDFKALCTSLSIEGPVILVGHSWGGFLVRYYAAQGSVPIAGLVLIDASHEEQEKRYWELDSLAWTERYEAQKEMMEIAKSGEYDVPLGAIAEAETNYFGRKVMRGGENPLKLPEVPIAVLTSLVKPQQTQAETQLWRDMHSEWVDGSKNALWLITEEDGHYIHKDNPQFALMGIRYVHDQVKTRSGKDKK